VRGQSCFCRAWIFAAGLVPGFPAFANVKVCFVESAVTGVQEVLKKLSYQIPQAEHYHDVLSRFSEAIDKRNKQIANRRPTSPYLGQILIIEFQDSHDQQYMIPQLERCGYS
jgi:hypothetical protein